MKRKIFVALMLMVTLFISGVSVSSANAGEFGTTQTYQSGALSNGTDIAGDMETTSVINEELPGLTNADLIEKFEAGGTAGFAYYLNWIIRISIALGSIVAVSTLVFGGFLYITTDNFLSKGKGKTMIQNSMWGLLLLLMSFVLLGQINSDLLKIKFKPAQIKSELPTEEELRSFELPSTNSFPFSLPFLEKSYDEINTYQDGNIEINHTDYKNSTPENIKNCKRIARHRNYDIKSREYQCVIKETNIVGQLGVIVKTTKAVLIRHKEAK